MTDVRRVRPEEWRVLRDVRLRALADAPAAFETRFEDARLRPEEWWVDWAARSASGDRQAMFLRLGRRRSRRHRGDVRRGPRQALADLDVDRSRGAPAACRTDARRHRRCLRASTRSRELLLEVTDGNDAAFALYRSCGFEETGRGEPHSDGERTRELRLRL